MLANIFIFIISLVMGAGIFIGYQHFNGNSTPTPGSQKTTPAPTISFALEQAPRNSLVGTIVSLQGSTFWESRIATEPAELNEKVALQQGEKIATGDDGSMTVEFAETVTINLEENTLLHLTQTLPANIVITQESGIAKYVLSSSEIPVSIRIKHLLVAIKRGKTRISLTEETSRIKVEVTDGSAEVAYNNASFTSQRTRISEGETFIFNNDKRKGSVE